MSTLQEPGVGEDAENTAESLINHCHHRGLSSRAEGSSECLLLPGEEPEAGLCALPGHTIANHQPQGCLMSVPSEGSLAS